MPSKILSLIGLAALVGAAASAPHPMKHNGVEAPASNEARRLSSSDEVDDDVPEPPAPVETPPPTPGAPPVVPPPTVQGMPPTVSVPEFVSHGCYDDELGARIMDIGLLGNSSMTTEMCADTCEGSAYFGTQYSVECWCGGEDTVYDLHGPSTSCDYPCAGDFTETCGGLFAMSVYEFTA